MRVFVVLCVLLVACDRAVAPRAFTLGPGCWTRLAIDVPNATPTVVRAHYRDCTRHNLDSLRAVGWEVLWDTTWVQR